MIDVRDDHKLDVQAFETASWLWRLVASRQEDDCARNLANSIPH
jgi:hypothetical protein